MKTFTIENETNNITLHASVKEAESVPGAERFSTEAALGIWHGGTATTRDENDCGCSLPVPLSGSRPS